VRILTEVVETSADTHERRELPHADIIHILLMWIHLAADCPRTILALRRRLRRATPSGEHEVQTLYILATQHVRQLVFTHRLGQRQASVVLAA
jgi:hypothetical protein